MKFNWFIAFISIFWILIVYCIWWLLKKKFSITVDRIEFFLLLIIFTIAIVAAFFI
jgi:hypothetical protein